VAFCVLRLGFVLGASVLGWPFTSFAADDAGQGDGVSFQLKRGHLIAVKCSVGGIKNLIGIIDTGASETVVDISLVRRLSLATKAGQAIFITQQAKVWEVDIPGLTVGPITVDRLEGIATDLSSLTAELGIRPSVLIGMDLLHRSNFVIDYQSRRLVFGSAPPLAHSAPLVSLASGPARSSSSPWRFAIIESTIGGEEVRLQVDSGFDGLLLYRERTAGLVGDGSGAGLPPAPALARNESHIANLGQRLLVHNFDSRRVRIGDWQAPLPRGQRLVEARPPVTVPAPFDGLIGTALLSHRRVAFDFQSGMMYWE
jgi:predicted aspartyl protease